MTARPKAAWFLAVALVFTLAVPCVLAQTTTSILEGKVTDSTGAVLPGVTVEVKGSTVTRAVVTENDGHYRAVALPAGNYQVTVSKSGFKTKILGQVTIVLDRTVSVDVPMEVAPRSEQVTVTAEVPLVDTTTASTRQVIDTSVIDSIPLNGRNYLDLIQMLPGVARNDVASRNGRAKDAMGSILGERAGNASFMMDGAANTDEFHGGVLQAFTQDAVQEFEVIEAGYKAEFGHGSGGVVNVITKSGSNSYHGSGFLFHRNDAFDSTNQPGQGVPKLKRYNFGGTFGGPVRKDKSWFFGSVERVQEKRGSIYVPDIPPMLLTGEDFGRQPQTDDTRIFGKYNQQLNNKNELRAELSWSRSKLQNQLASTTSLPSSSLNNGKDTYLGKVGVTTVFSPHMFLDSSFSVRDQNFAQNQGMALGIAQGVIFLDDGTSYDWGPPAGSVQTLQQRYFTGREVLSFFAGEKHSAKFGFDFVRTLVNGNNGTGFMQNIILGTRDSFAQYGPEEFAIPQGVAFLNPGDNLSKLRNNGISWFAQDDWKLHPSLTLSLGVRWDYDSRFNVGTNFAPRAGLIYSPDKKTVVNASFGMFYDRYRIGLAQPIPSLGGFNATSVTYFDYPRFTLDNLIPFPNSMSWVGMMSGDPAFLYTHYGITPGALVSRSNIQTLTGMTPDQFLTSVGQYIPQYIANWVATNNPPPDQNPFAGYAQLPIIWDPLTGFLAEDDTGDYRDQIRVAKPFRTPYNNTFSVSVQREFGNEFFVGATYVKRSLRDIMGIRIANLSPEARVVQRPITTDGQPLDREYGPWYSGKYDALMLTFNKRFGHRFQAMANYTFARATDNLVASSLGIGIAQQGGASTPSDNLNLNADLGNSDLLVPHSFNTSGLVELPWGVSFSGVMRWTSGVYFTATQDPVDVDGDGIYFLTAPGTKRNQFRGPETVNLDLRLLKKIKISERFSASLLAEAFNLTNARNPSDIYTGFVNGKPGPNFGTTRVPMPGREAQFGLKFEF